MKITIEVKEVANGYIFSTSKDDGDHWVCEGEIDQLDLKGLGEIIRKIIKVNS